MSLFRPRYDTSGTWYKGNTHVHSTASDGGKTFAELGDMYAAEGYDWLFRTDHWVASDVDGDGADAPLLWLDGIELHGQDHSGADYHVVCLGAVCDLDRSDGLVRAVEQARAQGGLLILAHPHWMGNTFEDALRLGCHGVEIYNHVCHWLNGKGDGLAYWEAMLCRQPNTLGFAVDDAHIRPEHPGWNGGWIAVNVPTLSREAVMEAIWQGHFYSSCGPAFHTIQCEEGRVFAEMSPVQFARLVGPSHWGQRVGSFDERRFNQVTFEIPEQWPYAYLEIEDEKGRRAWTNPLYVAET